MASELATQLFDQLTEANKAALGHTKLGRQQMARDVSAIIGTLSARKGPMECINELIQLCRREA